ncbi:Uncharacterized protein FWK35_00021522 [Aphis craccivora]|uniref:Uncharacterized protein n=1 Tax=Aphis craccivora TaxID=307492 RepID=A0A6G0YZC8_APHCR|nr:Uncharacterized protein FWK35_00021522 [Aphis craccivora]
MHRRTAVFALLQFIMTIFACDLRSEISRSQRSIIDVPTFFDDRFAQEQRHSVVGYDGQYRQMFEEAVDDGRCYSLKSRENFQLPAQPEKPRYVRNDDAWWLAVIENINRNNEQLLQRETEESKETYRKCQCILSCSQ